MPLLKLCSLPLCLLILLGVTAQGKAGYVTAILNGTNTLDPSAPVTINLGDGSPPTTNYTPGKVNWTLQQESGISLPRNFITFCIELTQDISLGSSYTYNLTDLANSPKPGTAPTGGLQGMGALKADKIAELWGGYYTSIGIDGTRAAAFQLDVWKIEYDWGGPGATDFASGNFRAGNNAAATSLASAWLTNLQTHSYQPAQGLVGLTSPDAQDQIVQSLPLPSTAYLAGIGILCLLAYYGYTGRRLRSLNRATVPVAVQG